VVTHSPTQISFSPPLHSLSLSLSLSHSLSPQGGTQKLPLLAPEDLQAFLNRVYLEDAVAAAPGATSLALQHVIWSCGEREALKLLDFVVEKISEYALAPGGASLLYRPYFRVVSELLLSRAVDVSLAFDAALPTLLSRADALVARQAGNDAEFVYSVCKLLHRVGTASAEGHLCVMRCKEQWAGLRAAFVAHAHSAAAATAATAAAQSLRIL